MWDHRSLSRIDFRLVFILLALMGVSLLVIAATTGEEGSASFLTHETKIQMQWFLLGWALFFFFAGLDYRKLRPWAWPLYALIILLLVGLFFTTPIQNVQRWYRLPFLGRAFQPSEYAKLVLVITLSWFLEYKENRIQQNKTALQGILIMLIPFLLILKEPDLGSALVLYPIGLVMFYIAGMKRRVTLTMASIAVSVGILVSLMFTGVISHEGFRPYATSVIREYQYERLNPNTYHQKASQTAIALGGVTGSGWRRSEFTGGKWLPAAHTDSVFAAFAEEFGLVGVTFMLLFFFGLIYLGFQVVTAAKDFFGRLLATGITVTLAMHVIVNIGMMCGFLPITGVPLILVTFGGSSVVSTMMALGILQSIYSRRFTF